MPHASPRHDEELAHHAAALANVLLHQLAARHANEGAVGVVRHRTRKQRLACTCWKGWCSDSQVRALASAERNGVMRHRARQQRLACTRLAGQHSSTEIHGLASEKKTIGVVRHRARQQRLACS